MGVPTSMASTMPGMPTMAQSEIRISPICPAMAPSTMPKFSPMPAMMGIRRDRIKNEFRPIRIRSSWTRWLTEKPDRGMATAEIAMKTMGTALSARNVRGLQFLPALLIVSPSPFSSGRRGSSRC